MNSPSMVYETSLNEIPKAWDLSTRKEIIINLGLIWNKTRIFLSTSSGSPITSGKKRKEKAKSEVSEHTIKVCLNFSCCIHADVNKRQITEGKNSSDKMEEKRRGNIPRMINLRFWIRALPLNPKSEGKQTVSTVLKNCVFYLPSFKRKLSRSWLLPKLFLVSFFLFNKRILLF